MAAFDIEAGDGREVGIVQMDRHGKTEYHKVMRVKNLGVTVTLSPKRRLDNLVLRATMISIWGGGIPFTIHHPIKRLPRKKKKILKKIVNSNC